jgi:hypothetical protein
MSTIPDLAGPLALLNAARSVETVNLGIACRITCFPALNFLLGPWSYQYRTGLSRKPG